MAAVEPTTMDNTADSAVSEPQADTASSPTEVTGVNAQEGSERNDQSARTNASKRQYLADNKDELVPVYTRDEHRQHGDNRFGFNLEAVYKLRVKVLRDKLIKEALSYRYSADDTIDIPLWADISTSHTENLLHDYGKSPTIYNLASYCCYQDAASALKNYEFISSKRNPYGDSQLGPSFRNSSGCFQMLEEHLLAAESKAANTQSVTPSPSKYSAKEDLKALRRCRSNNYFRTPNFRNVWNAYKGPLAVMVPIYIMTLVGNSLLWRLVITATAVLVVGLWIAMKVDQPTVVLVGVATYSAVLVVFLGTVDSEIDVGDSSGQGFEPTTNSTIFNSTISNAIFANLTIWNSTITNSTILNATFLG
ncbi:hypothetical protein QBC35DRAFT_550161 [Podospora australis]|uniref:Uncharacterized protein n=1 Tax=Podospora australis TaxID=1536484 RepID=A0AAN6WHD1_9PEZI|nr:hypothetical protein QBC35DRAFT_550161 [Podospora australis]